MIRNILSILLCSVFIAAAQSTNSVLKSGDPIPDVKLRDVASAEVKLRVIVSERPTVLIFYRGSWCPFCTRHLKDLAGIETDLKKSGAQLIAISVDTPEKIRQMPDRDSLGYQILSDSSADAARAFGLAFKVEDSLVKKYKESYKIDLEAASGRDHHLLPHPAVFVAGTNGIIRFAHHDPDYKKRLEPAKILEAVRSKQ